MKRDEPLIRKKYKYSINKNYVTSGFNFIGTCYFVKFILFFWVPENVLPCLVLYCLLLYFVILYIQIFVIVDITDIFKVCKCILEQGSKFVISNDFLRV